MNPNSASHTAAVLQELPPHRAGDQSIVRLASSRTFVRGDVRVAALYEAMTADRSIQAVGVVNADDSLLGVIVRRDFLATMARPYAQDVLRKCDGLPREEEPPYCDVGFTRGGGR